MANPTTERIGWWGGPDTRPRCPATDKVIIADAETAAAKTTRINARDPRVKGRMQSYFCRHCRAYHVGKRRGA